MKTKLDEEYKSGVDGDELDDYTANTDDDTEDEYEEEGDDENKRKLKCGTRMNVPSYSKNYKGEKGESGNTFSDT